MTHDELTEILDSCIKGAEYGPYEWGFVALRAVVELHEQVGVVCGWCTCYDCDHVAMYPCKTVRAIQGALE